MRRIRPLGSTHVRRFVHNVHKANPVAGVIAGFGIGVVAALMGVAGGELLIPTIVLLYAVDIKIAGSLSLAVSLPTMLVAFARYSRDQSFGVLRANRRFVVAMAAGSLASYRSAKCAHRLDFSSIPIPGASRIFTRPPLTGVLSRNPPTGWKTPG